MAKINETCQIMRQSQKITDKMAINSEKTAN